MTTQQAQDIQPTLVYCWTTWTNIGSVYRVGWVVIHVLRLLISVIIDLGMTSD